jgi:hypothetical protein
VLDFIGMGMSAKPKPPLLLYVPINDVMYYIICIANLPSKTQLLTLDLLIIFLQLILLCIAYETSLSLVLPPETIDPLSPIDDSSAGVYVSHF